MQLPRPLYFLLVTVVTQFILAIAAVIAFLPTGLLGQLPLSMIGFLLVYNIVVATLVAIILTNNSLQNKSAVIKGGGLVLGHLVGVIVGGLIGSRYGGTASAIAGAAVLYLVVGWIGSRMSVAVASYLDRQAAPPSPHDLETALRLARPNTSSLFLYGAVIPALLMAAAIFLKTSGLQVARFPAILPTARLILVVLSLFSILIPWLRRTRSTRRRRSTFAPRSVLSLVGLGLSLAPAIYGFLLFVAFGMSFAELSLFAVVASIATTTWGVNGATN
jgi:hypothetical protein